MVKGDFMKVNIFKTAEEIGVAVARIFVDEVKNNPNCVLGLATGASPIPTYDNIKKMHKEENVHFLDGNATDCDAECKRYDNEINEAGGIDIQLLGIGNNAHIGFNEPAESFTDGSFKVKLTDSTIEANKIYFDENPMPHYALTMGVKQIMSAKKIILIATGPKKAEAIKNMVKGEVTPLVPASILQEHDDVLIFLDEAAASLL